MRNLKKYFATALCVALCVTTLAGCGKKKTTEQKVENIDYQKAVTLTEYKKLRSKKQILSQSSRRRSISCWIRIKRMRL